MFAKWDNKVWTFRGDHKQPEKRKPIAAKLIAGMLEVSGVNQVITVDIHSPQTEGFFSIPVDCLTARFLFERSVAGHHNFLWKRLRMKVVSEWQGILSSMRHTAIAGAVCSSAVSAVGGSFLSWREDKIQTDTPVCPLTQTVAVCVVRVMWEHQAGPVTVTTY